jgi:hypothetical protein
VQSTDLRAQTARNLLDRYQIDINAAENGIPLRPNSHHGRGLHSGGAIDRVNLRLQNAVRNIRNWATAREKLLEALAEIKREIGLGRFP